MYFCFIEISLCCDYVYIELTIQFSKTSYYAKENHELFLKFIRTTTSEMTMTVPITFINGSAKGTGPVVYGIDLEWQ